MAGSARAAVATGTDRIVAAESLVILGTLTILITPTTGGRGILATSHLTSAIAIPTAAIPAVRALPASRTRPTLSPRNSGPSLCPSW